MSAPARLASWRSDLFVTDRFGAGMFIASAAWGLFTRGHIWPGGWPNYGFPGALAFVARSDRRACVRHGSRWNWTMTAATCAERVLKGAHAGKRLEQLGKDDVVALYAGREHR